MAPIQFKFKERDVRVASFPDHPTWEVLSARIEDLYRIPAADVGISYIDTEGYVDYNKSYELRKVTQMNRDEITINTDEELQAYYTTIPPVHNAPIKFTVKNIRVAQRPRPPTDILVDIDDSWTPIFSAVPLTPNRTQEAEARIEEIADEDEQNQYRGGSDDDAQPFLNIPGRGHQDDEDDEDDASSIDSIIENDLPDKKPIHVNRYSSEFHRQPSFRSVSRSSSKTGSVAESRSMSSSDEDGTESPVVLPVPEQTRIPSPRNSGYEFAYNTPPAERRLVDPVQDRRRSRSRSPAPNSPLVAARDMSMDRSSRRSSRAVPEHPSPIIIPTIDTTSPRGFPASVDMNSIPSPAPIIIPVPTIPEESFLLERTSVPAPDPPSPIIPSREHTRAAVNTATSTTTPSLTNDIASLLDALTHAFNEHPELSEGLRNIVRNASQGVYWNNATDAIQNIRDSVVNDALEARHVILNRSSIARRDISGQAQAEAGRKIAEALGNVFRSLGTILGSDTSFATSESGSGVALAPVPAPAPAPAPAAPQTLAAPYAQGQRGEDDFLADPRTGSPAPIKATPLIRGQDFPPSDGQSLSRSSSRSSSPANDPDVYPATGVRVSSHRSRKNPYPTPQFVPFVWGPPPKRRSGDRDPYGPPVPVPIPAPYVYGRHRHQRSQSNTGGSAYPPPPGPPPSGQYYMSPYPSPPYAYPRYPPPPPDPRMYPGGGDYGREYARSGYPGIGSGGNVRRSNTLPPSFAGPITPIAPGIVQPAPPPPEIPRASQPSPGPSFVNAAYNAAPVTPAPAVIILPPPQSSVSTSNSETPQSSAVVVSSPKSIDDKFAELEEVKRLYKEKKEEWRLEREERRIQREKERAERHAKRQARLPAPPPKSAPPPRPAINAPGFSRPSPSSNVHHNNSDDDSGTERAFPPAQQAGAVGLTSPPYDDSSAQRLHKEVFDRLNSMGFTIRSYPQLNTLVPTSVRKHVMMRKGEVPDDVIIQQVLEDIFTAPIANKI